MPISDRLRFILTVRGTPRGTAFAFAMGVFIGISPFLGLHTVMAILFASLFRLNRLVTLAGAYVTNPWTIIPIYTFATWLGAKMTGYRGAFSQVEFRDLNVVNLFKLLKGLVVPFFVGTLFLGLVAGLASYFIVYHMLKRMRRP